MKKYIKRNHELVVGKIGKGFSFKAEDTIKQVTGEILLVSIVVHIILEILNKRSIVLGLLNVFTNPIMFISGFFLLTMFFSIAILFPKRHFWYLFIGTLWISLGVSNFVILSFRTTPLSAIDFRLLHSVMDIFQVYLKKSQMILIGIIVISIITFLILIYSRFPKTKVMIRRGLFIAFSSYLLFIGSYSLALKTGSVTTNYGNIATAFRDYGFVYCFSESVVNVGIDEPNAYSEEDIDSLIEDIHFKSTKLDQEELISLDVEAVNKMPNIIFVQLESFFDINRIKSLDFNNNPIPNMTTLMNEYSYGYVTVPSIGAGTANTEFEILSGMSLDYFGPGEYPYKTILEDTPVESIAYYLNESGYHTHAIHNNTGTFYSRDKVYPMLGFESFSSLEFMENVKYNETGWATDSILSDEIMKALRSSDSKDFIFTVTVQSHGKYPKEKVLNNPPITIKAIGKLPTIKNDDSSLTNVDNDELANESSQQLLEETLNQYTYYVNQLHQTDQFIGNLIDELSGYNEPTIVVFYGDHMPNLGITSDDLREGSPFQTEYVVWDNLGLKRQHANVMAYQLGAEVFDKIGYSNGLMNEFHQTMKNNANYNQELQLLQYDILYGEKFAYNGENPYKKKTMTMGVNQSEINSIKEHGEALIVRGKHFTPWSEVYINGERVDTIYVDNETLLVPFVEPVTGMSIVVSHVTKKGKVLDSTKIFNF